MGPGVLGCAAAARARHRQLRQRDGGERLRPGQGVVREAKYARLAKIKAQYDPGNVFHRNMNILPG
ncbi:BBE domain-containing protein [Kribbella sp. NPDC051718]|uniref:BBE domain-containing protein n=1 Tax=Kribbella sp. NPDC051718 TaxID=3155168 RepID=UPI0034241642